MDYVGTVIRPPSEADSIILQVTLGCSHNGCTFCSAYKDKTFGLKTFQTIDKDIQFAKTCCKRQSTVFLADGDALAMPFEQLVKILQEIRSNLPWIKKINSYASPSSLLGKTPDELKVLRKFGLKRLYLGIESGSKIVLKKVNKGSTRQQIITACLKAKEANFYLSTTVILGLGGKEFSEEHARETASILNEIHPNNISALTLMLPESAPLKQLHERGNFELLDSRKILQELMMLLELITLDRVQFHANHASNYLPISGILNRDKKRFLLLIADALAGNQKLVPEHFRAL